MNQAENPNPEIIQIKNVFSQEELQKRLEQEMDDNEQDEIDQFEIFQIIRHIKDPEHPLSLEQLKVVSVNLIKVEKQHVLINFTPTIPHCSMAQMIGLTLKVQLTRSLPSRIQIDVLVTPGTHNQEQSINKQINDKQRVAAAIQNPSIFRIIKEGIVNTDALPQINQ